MHDLLLVELFDVEHDLEVWVRGHSRSLKTVPFETLGCSFLFTFHRNYGRIFSHFGDIRHQRMPNLDLWVWGRSRSFFFPYCWRVARHRDICLQTKKRNAQI